MATVKVRPRQPNGYPMLCSVCGPIGSSSLPAAARQVVRDHEEWHRRQGN